MPTSVESRWVLSRTLRAIAQTEDSGDRIGRYVLEAKIGRGGQAEVWRAWDPSMQRDVAIKVLGSKDEGRVARFATEARLLSEFSHPNIATVFDVGMARGRPYFVMEYLGGQTLDLWLATDPGPDTAFARMLETADALAHAHATGVVHGDFKPQNIVITAGGAKVIDFGFSHRHDPAPRGMTPRYAAPELRRGEPATFRSDVYAYCLTLHEALSGHLPESTRMHESIEPTLRAVLRRGLDPATDRRWPNMGALRDSLVRRRVRRPWTVLVAFGLASAAIGSLLDTADAGACSMNASSLDAAWTEGTAQQIVDRFTSLDAQDGPAIGDHVRRAVDSHVEGWAAAVEQACRAQSPPGPLRCLRESSTRLETYLEVWKGAGAPEVAHARAALEELGSPKDCVGATPVAAEVPERTAQVARLEALYRATEDPAHLTGLEELLSDCRGTLEYACVRAMWLSGVIRNGHGHIGIDQYRDATYAAWSLGADHLAERAGLAWAEELVRHVEYAKAQRVFDMLRSWQPDIRDPRLQVGRAIVGARLAAARGEREVGVALLSDVIKGVDTLPPRLAAKVLETRAKVRLEVKTADNGVLAQADLQAAMMLLSSVYAPGKGRRPYTALARAAQAQGHHEDTLRYMMLMEGQLDWSHQGPAGRLSTKVNIGTALMATGRFEEALDVLQPAYKTAVSLFGEVSELAAASAHSTTVALARLGRFDEAEVWSRRAILATERRYGDAHPRTVGVRLAFGDVLYHRARTVCARGRYDLCEELLETAVLYGDPEIHELSLSALHDLASGLDPAFNPELGP